MLELLKGNIKFKHKPINVPSEEIDFFIRNTNEPETLYVKSNIKGFHMIDVVFDVKGRRGPYYNKQYYFDGKKIKSIDHFLNLISEKVVLGGFVTLYATFDKNSPNVFLKTLEKIKKDGKCL